MKKTQIKDATRNIKKNLLSWISVVFIAAMAASSYLGICYSAASMKSGSGNQPAASPSLIRSDETSPKKYATASL